jgi:hypothetical protein
MTQTQKTNPGAKRIQSEEFLNKFLTLKADPVA